MLISRLKGSNSIIACRRSRECVWLAADGDFLHSQRVFLCPRNRCVLFDFSLTYLLTTIEGDQWTTRKSMKSYAQCSTCWASISWVAIFSAEKLPTSRAI